MEVTDYTFKTRNWPPPGDRKGNASYLFGFDEDNQPYIIRWEKQEGYEGWVAATLSTNTSSKATAVPRHFVGDTVGKIIKWWADAPLLLEDVFRLRDKKDKQR